MDLSPKNFFVGIIDFFSILLPGAVLAYFLRDRVADRVLPTALSGMSPTVGWIVFAVSSYLLGHFVFLLGSWLDELYDVARKQTLNHRIRRLARTGELMPKVLRVLLWLVFKREQDLAVDRAKRIKEHYLTPLAGREAVNTFQWAKARLTLEEPEALAVVQRFEADSKFFRSLVAVLILLLVSGGWNRGWRFITMDLALLPLALWRYMEQRYKATNQAYWFILTLEGKSTTVSLAAPKAQAEPTHAGGVVYRGDVPNVEYLLVEAKTDSSQLVLPKGHIELSEQAREAAVREVHEETGVWAVIDRELADVRYEVNKESVRARFYLMRYLEQGWPSDTHRKARWRPFTEALVEAKFDEAKSLLKQADGILREARKDKT